jgi:stage V sporulation protein AE
VLEKIRVILITDGDKIARHVVEDISRSLGLRCISASGGNPTPISGARIVKLLKEVPHDPVLVMFDDRGDPEQGNGERAIEYVASHPDIEVLGAVAVASNTTGGIGIPVDVCISGKGEFVYDAAVDKKGDVAFDTLGKPIIHGDTVDILNDVVVPVVVGVGDVGKMHYADDRERGAPITRKAIEEILKRSGIDVKPENKQRNR